MRKFLLAVFAGLVLPGALLKLTSWCEHPCREEINLSLGAGEEIQQLSMEDYLVGVLLAEMPADFEQEALKAQAVAARTYALYHIQNRRKHDEFDVCASPLCCQGYISEEKYLLAGGTERAVAKIKDAVSKTENYVLVYDGRLIDATYFSSSGGRTEAAAEVWGTDIPYLQSTASPGEDGESGMKEIGLTKESFCSALGLASGVIRIGEPVYTAGNGLKAVKINGVSFTGQELRQKLGLRSTCIQFRLENDTVTVITVGHGHRVGLSQHGANAMAQSGAGYLEILQHYYKGTFVVAHTQ